MVKDNYFVYMLKCNDCNGSLYTGYTSDLEKRLTLHSRGKGSKYVRSRLPVTLVYSESFEDKSEAMRRECFIKSLSRCQKTDLIGEVVL